MFEQPRNQTSFINVNTGSKPLSQKQGLKIDQESKKTYHVN